MAMCEWRVWAFLFRIPPEKYALDSALLPVKDSLNHICSYFAIHVLYDCHTERRLRPCRCLLLGAQMTSFRQGTFESAEAFRYSKAGSEPYAEKTAKFSTADASADGVPEYATSRQINK
jgi:hypothetical protein